MFKLKPQYFGYLMQWTDSFEKTLMLGKIEGRRRRGWQRMRLLDGIMDSMDMGLVDSRSWWWIGRPGVLQFMGSQRVGHNWASDLNWTEGAYQIKDFLPVHCITFLGTVSFTYRAQLCSLRFGNGVPLRMTCKVPEPGLWTFHVTNCMLYIYIYIYIHTHTYIYI